MRCKRWPLAATLGLISMALVYGQEKPTRLAFEVTSIKPSGPPKMGEGGGIRALPGGLEYSARGVPVDLMISLMYKIPMRKITGGPNWIHSDRWDVDAKADHPGYTLDDLHVMYQNMLADEFKLKFHKETKEGPVYALTIDKSGLKMKVNETPEPFQIPINGGPDGITGTRVPMQYLTWWLGQQLQQDGRPVINETGLDGDYDFKLVFLPELPPNFNRENAPPNPAVRILRPTESVRRREAAARPEAGAAKGTGGILRYRPRGKTRRELAGNPDVRTRPRAE